MAEGTHEPESPARRHDIPVPMAGCNANGMGGNHGRCLRRGLFSA